MKPENLLPNLAQLTFVGIMAAFALGASLLGLQVNAQKVQAAPFVQPLMAPCSTSAITLTAVQDTWIDEANPNLNNGTDTNLETKPDASQLKRPLIQFDLSSIPTNSSIKCAKLRVFETVRDDDQTIHIHRIIASWSESQATWNDRQTSAPWAIVGGDYDSTETASFTADANGVYRDIDVTALVQFWVDNPGSNFGLLLRSTTISSTGVVQFESLENTNKPQLVVQHVSEPRLSINKSSNSDSVLPGGTITYTIVVSNDGNTNATGAILSDTLPVDTNFVTGSITLDPPGVGAKGISPPTLASNLTLAAGQQLTVTFVVTASTVVSPTTIFTNTAAITSSEVLTPSIATNTVRLTGFFFPSLWVGQSGPLTATVSDTVTFNYVALNANSGDGTPIRNVTVTDDVAGVATYTGGDFNANNQLDKNEAWFYAATYTIKLTDTNPLINTATAQGEDKEGDIIMSGNSVHRTTINYPPPPPIFMPVIWKNS